MPARLSHTRYDSAMNARLPRALPFLDDRHSAMLADMGVTPWWVPRALLPERLPGSASHPARAPARPAAAPPLAPRAAGPSAASVLPDTRAADQITPPLPVTGHRPEGTANADPDTDRAAVPVGEARRPRARLEGAASPSLNDAVADLDWDALETAIRACQRCPLAQCRTQAVPGVGDRQPDWLIVGEAPGEEEDRQGEPFVGRAGQLLDRMLAALDLRRGQQVYIANVLKCRPPRNRNPEPEEIARCAPYLLRQIALLRPRLILAMGRFAAQTLLAEGGCDDPQTLLRTPLGRLRGRVHRGRFAVGDTVVEVPIVVTYHPAYLLRNPVDKGKAWADLCLAHDALSPQAPRA